MHVLRFIKNWTLPIAMLTGALSYLLYSRIPWFDPTRPYAPEIVAWVQPLLLFAMLFITFCKVNVKELRPTRWHALMLLVQVGAFVLLSLPLLFPVHLGTRVLLEGAMLCMICPTATAAAVVTSKLGGNAGSLTTYIIFINLAVALAVPLMVPLVHPHPDFTFWTSFVRIIGRVFPLLFCPFVLAMAVRRFRPSLQALMLRCKDLAFYLWAVSLSLAIAVTVRSIVHSHVPVSYQCGIAAVSLVACVAQFWIGRLLGIRYHDKISATQAFGQKNTVFAIWMGYTFLTPVTAIAGGFYSVWHNVFNSYQLYKMRQQESQPESRKN